MLAFATSFALVRTAFLCLKGYAILDNFQPRPKTQYFDGNPISSVGLDRPQINVFQHTTHCLIFTYTFCDSDVLLTHLQTA